MYQSQVMIPVLVLTVSITSDDTSTGPHSSLYQSQVMIPVLALVVSIAGDDTSTGPHHIGSKVKFAW